MTQTAPEWAYLCDESGRRWHNLADRSQASTNGSTLPNKLSRAIYAISSNDLISVPQWVNSKEKDIIDQVVDVEQEKLGIQGLQGPGRTIDWRPVEISESRTLVQSVSIPWELDETLSKSTSFSFLPQYALYPPPENAVILWKEEGIWIAGYSRGIRWAHVQPLGVENISTLASELALTLVELSARDILESTNKIIIWHPIAKEDLLTIEQKIGLPALVAERPEPSTSASGKWRLEPHSISARKLAKKRKRKAIFLCSLLAYLLVLGVGLAFLQLQSIEKANALLAGKIKTHQPEAILIEVAIEKWDELAPALDPSRSPVEVFYRVSSLLPAKGLRLVNFQFLDHRTIVVKAEASTMSNALQFKGQLEKAETLSDYNWAIPQPKTKGNLTEFLATGTMKN